MGWEQNPVPDQQLVLLEVAEERWFLAGLMWLTSPRSQPSEIPRSPVPCSGSMLSLDATWLAPHSKLKRTATSSKQPSLFTLIQKVNPLPSILLLSLTIFLSSLPSDTDLYFYLLIS